MISIGFSRAFQFVMVHLFEFKNLFKDVSRMKTLLFFLTIDANTNTVTNFNFPGVILNFDSVNKTALFS